MLWFKFFFFFFFFALKFQTWILFIKIYFLLSQIIVYEHYTKENKN